MNLLGVIPALLLLLLHSTAAKKCADDTVYLVALNSQPLGGSTETVCVHVRTHHHEVSLSIHLEYGSNNEVILRDHKVKLHYYRCIHFKVPEVIQPTLGTVVVKIRGHKKHREKTSKILIRPHQQVVIIQTDKPIYKPGQTVNFRIASLRPSFFTYNQVFPNIEIQDPSYYRIGHWYNVSTKSGILDLSFPTHPNAPRGVYTLTAWNYKNDIFTQTFELKDYVPPKYEVTIQLPEMITILDKTAYVTICAKNKYGKFVKGSVFTVVCRKRSEWMPVAAHAKDICIEFTKRTHYRGCITHELDLTVFDLNKPYYHDVIEVKTEVKDYDTGRILHGSNSMAVTADIITLLFDDSPTVFKVGMNYKGKVKVFGPNTVPIKRRHVYLTVKKHNDVIAEKTITTNDKGVATFSFDTKKWGDGFISVEARYHKKHIKHKPGHSIRIPNVAEAYLWLESFYSRSKSFLRLALPTEPFSCWKVATVMARYLIHGSALKHHQKTLPVFYMVMSKGKVVQHGHVVISVDWKKKENRGSVWFTLDNVKTINPIAQVVMYAILPNREAIADSKNYPIELCLHNKVHLNFVPPQELPGDVTEMTLKAHPGSLCSVRAIDQSLLLMRPDKELNVQSVFNLLPVPSLYGFPYNIEDENLFGCFSKPPFVDDVPGHKPRKHIWLPFGGHDAYSMFRNIGMKILTNAEVMNPKMCELPASKFQGSGDNASHDAPGPVKTPPAVIRPAKPEHRFSPETWIWDLIPVGDSGIQVFNKTVPDSITTWVGGAFCTSHVGLGVAPRAEVTAFRPFFVSLTLPTSVIRGEVFKLKATVFNYLQGCMAMNVKLAHSDMYTAHRCKHCRYKVCLCAFESHTFTWIITAHTLGKVSFTVTAEAVNSRHHCGSTVITVPEIGHVDTVTKDMPVHPEGMQQIVRHNGHIYLSDNRVDMPVTLSLPEVYANQSVKASVSVLGDVMGRALKHLPNLVALPFGCGEQNMLLFTPNVYILHYLQKSGQLTDEVKHKATKYLITGYHRELMFRRDDGSYSAFGMSDPSGNTWLTAYVMKSFVAAKHHVFIADEYVDQARTWLGQQQREDGCFEWVGHLIRSHMKGGVEDEVALTGYVVAAMLESGTDVSDAVVTKGLGCLKKASHRLMSTYTMALLSYTFTLAKDKHHRHTLIERLHKRAVVLDGRRHWSREHAHGKVDSLEVEMTSYVLLALLSGPVITKFDLKYSSTIVHWLIHHQNPYGGFFSTQDTVVALQALSLYSATTYHPKSKIIVKVSSPADKKIKFHVDQENRLQYQESELDEVEGKFMVKAEGTGTAFIQFTLQYNIPTPKDDSSFSIHVVPKHKHHTHDRRIILTVTVRFNGHRKETNMVIIDLKILTGFLLVHDSVQKVTESKDGIVKEVDQKGGHVIMYLNKLKHGHERTYTLEIEHDIEVNNLQPAVVKVYDYYELSDTAVTYYTVPCS